MAFALKGIDGLNVSDAAALKTKYDSLSQAERDNVLEMMLCGQTFANDEAAAMLRGAMGLGPVVPITPITSVDVAVTSPATDAVPSLTASATGNFTIGNVTWTPNDNSFKGAKTYTTQVVLTANRGNAFKDIDLIVKKVIPSEEDARLASLGYTIGDNPTIHTVNGLE